MLAAVAVTLGCDRRILSCVRLISAAKGGFSIGNIGKFWYSLFIILEFACFLLSDVRGSGIGDSGI